MKLFQCIIICGLLMIVYSPLRSQSRAYGIKAGLNHSRIIDYEIDNIDKPLFPAFHIGITFTKRINNLFVLHTETYYSLKGDVYEYYTGHGRERTNTKIKIHTLEIPALIRFQPINKIFYLNLGPSIGILGKQVGIKTDKSLYSPDGFRNNIGKEYEGEVDICYQVGFGAEFNLENKGILCVDLRLVRGITDIFKNFYRNEATFSRTSTIMLGLNYSITKFPKKHASGKN